MGVSTNWYTIYGIKIPYDEQFAEEYDDIYNDSDTPFILQDCYEGEYIILGTVLFDSGDYRWGFEDGDSYKEFSTDELFKVENEYKGQFISKFPKFRYLVDEPFKVISMVHHS